MVVDLVYLSQVWREMLETSFRIDGDALTDLELLALEVIALSPSARSILLDLKIARVRIVTHQSRQRRLGSHRMHA